ncbi:hypothetical protein WI61_08110 [Burkholderia cepacia]|uniref:type VI secretion system lipoprotein TssJ n=1 Tax=Burkholderia cepacia TaxID=292 RepID=UPI0007562E4D|nr:type VI secretion system lipoprotein TssJ [Burkholderia cepacia]KVA46774.1 hypothetical protein WI47_21205 [Burkholderia cepacia]KVA51587.1 hypothetical protein WI48_25950 [Burkholderia cepacia]KVA70837.1 hypothetical protein WI49_35425 [Burkholderia cepacia]KVA78897.1 hypothetical protein WI51_27665 [Burkholderia cepacia]KVA78919.1 hypothetical protein WI52_25555 [Burkholderia cepacia]
MNVSCRIAAAMVAMAFWLAGCVTQQTPLPATTFNLKASPELNLNGEGRPSPVVVRIYQLAKHDDFDRAGFFDLYDHDRDVLGTTAVARTDIAIHPGEQLQFSRQLDPRTRDLAVMAAYREIDGAHWRAVADVSAPGTHVLTVALGASAIAISDAYQKPPGYWGKLKNFVKPVWKALSSALSAPPAVAMPNMKTPKTEFPEMEVPKVELLKSGLPKMESQ